MRCRAVLLKSEGLSSVQVGEQTGMTAPSVNGWVKRFESEGIKGLHTRPGQGRKPIMDCSDEEAVRKAIESDRQSVRLAKEAWQNSSGKEASELTFRRFLSALAQDIDV
ncbi:helix-turn-helix domain-containing protein [Dysgonomonas sp. PH5-37]|uniref:helix-turn-helix domain-containing protein n=2 Tax=unclassified Dysgonomonas TaxID=2630389 RepID=UPI0024733145|nr:helix-turn-helix domain-containing protein [Dysgonomonas sp. PH5-37]